MYGRLAGSWEPTWDHISVSCWLLFPAPPPPHLSADMRGELLTVFLASSLRSVNRLGRSYVTQGGRKIRNLPSSSPATVVQWRPRQVPGFSRLHLSRVSIFSYWPERAAHSQSEWRRPIPLREWNRQGRSYGTHNLEFFLLIQGFIVEIYTLWRNTWR
jgi:hypothetical protein